MKDYIFTSESITEGHPDKICDKIADSILDEALRQDPYSNMAVEATIKDDFVLIYGEADTKAHIDYAQIAKDVIRKIGYEEEYTVMIRVNKQSSEIHHAVNHADHVIGAGDQGIMFGYACNESDEYMPAPIYYAHKLARQLTKVRRENPLLKPDGKTQVSVEYKDGKIARIDTIVVSTQHSAQASQEQIREIVMNEVIRPCIEAELIDERKLCRGRKLRRFRHDRTQDRLRYLWRHGPHRRRMLLLQRPDQGRPQRGILLPLCREEHRGQRAG